MTTTEQIRMAATSRVISAERTLEGDGIEVRRAIPAGRLEAVGPFIFLDHFGPVSFTPGGAKGAPCHPHRGFETLTYLLEGGGEHRDSLGNHGTIGAGEAQWMRAGHGILHDEGADAATRRDGGRIEGVQFWINLPQGRKMSPPAYRRLAHGDIPELRLGDAALRLIAGRLGDRTGPVETFANPWLAHVHLPVGARIELEPDAVERAVYVTSGAVAIGAGTGGRAAAGQLALVAPEGLVALAAEDDTSLFLLGGDPLDAPIRRYGPFVMNTDEELAEAVRDYQAGRFGYIPT